MTALPLFESEFLCRTPARPSGDARARSTSLIPAREPAAGEQYRFHFDMGKCIGCKCCVVACNEQNGNPAGIHWRRVGEVEGGHFPFAQRHHLSMGCNHCLEPSCMIGCPVEAYTKDAATGIVLHSADTCIGCQYCTWNCSYGVPQYNPERGVVGKCDLCHNRLQEDLAPACVAACPEGAIAVELVDMALWRQDFAVADAPGLPLADDSISTTRVTLPENLLPDTRRVDTQRIALEHPHLPLVVMLVLTQLAVGAFATLAVLDTLGMSVRLGPAALISLALAGISLGASTLHLGRPVYAWRALRGLRRSWLSREVLFLSLFAGAASLYSAMLWFDAPNRAIPAVVTALLGVAGITCSAKIYIVKARPAWCSAHTVAEFFATAMLLGPLLVWTLGVHTGTSLAITAAAGGTAQLLTQTLKLLWLSRSQQFELRASSLLLADHLRRPFLARLAVLLGAGVVGPLLAAPGAATAAVLAAAIAGELGGRWLFFVSVVPKNMAAAFSARAGAKP